MSFAIFRVEGIATTGDLRGIAKHHKDRVSETNKDIDESKFDENITLIHSDSYKARFNEIVEPMKLEHDEKMKTERKDRIKSFEEKINSGRSDVACEFLFTSDTDFFEGASKEDITEWAHHCMDFVKEDIGIDESQMIHAIIHMDEETPHLHVVAVPLVKKYDGRAKKETWQLNRKHFIKTRDDMSRLQDKYFERMDSVGYDLERGELAKVTGRKHLDTPEFKEMQDKLVEVEKKLSLKTTELDSMTDNIDKATLKAIEAAARTVEEEDRGKLLKENNNVLEGEYERLKGIVDTYKSEKETLEDVRNKQVVMNNIPVWEEEVEEGGRFSKTTRRTGRLIVRQEDWENVKALAVTGEAFREQNERFKGENNRLKKEKDELTQENDKLSKENKRYRDSNSRLWQENTDLKNENSFLKYHLENAKDFIRESKLYGKFKEFSERIEMRFDRSNDFER